MKSMKVDINDVKSEMGNVKADINGVRSELSKEINGVRSEISFIKSDINGIKSEISDVKAGQEKLELRIECELIDKVKALFDAREVQNEINDRVITALGRIENKIDVLQLEAAQIRRIK